LQRLSKRLSKNSINRLKSGKNLLAFSAGVDSTALFFLLLEEDIEFDIAIVDYGIRESSKKEIEYAKELAKGYKKEIFIKEAKKIESNFEKEARDIRYSFFEKIIKKHKYQNLITAHQLNDRLEWFLMQLSKGAGLVELLGFDEIEKRDDYFIIRPLLNIKKSQLLDYLKENSYRYFIDESNFSNSYKRNYFRESFSNRLIDEFGDGVKNSLNYLSLDRELLLNLGSPMKKIEDLYIIKRGVDDIRVVDKTLKKLGYLLSSSQREEILKSSEIVIGGKFVVAKSSSYIFICPYIKVVMPKEFKERCRVLKIPKKIRTYLFFEGIDPNLLL